MTWTVRVEGADRLARTAADAARALRDLTAANAGVAAGVARAARPPRRTGALAASLTPSATATEAVVTSGLPYAGVIESGWAAHNIEPTRFLERAAEGYEPAALDTYIRAADNALAGVKGT